MGGGGGGGGREEGGRLRENEKETRSYECSQYDQRQIGRARPSVQSPHCADQNFLSIKAGTFTSSSDCPRVSEDCLLSAKQRESA